MPDMTPDDEQAADRLAFQLLHDAYCDLADILRDLNEAAASRIFDIIEKRLVDALSRLHAEKAEGENSAEILAAAGSRLNAVMEDARGLPCPGQTADGGRSSELTGGEGKLAAATRLLLRIPE